MSPMQSLARRKRQYNCLDIAYNKADVFVIKYDGMSVYWIVNYLKTINWHFSYSLWL